jgi:hypothetical protein
MDVQQTHGANKSFSRCGDEHIGHELPVTGRPRQDGKKRVDVLNSADQRRKVEMASATSSTHKIMFALNSF